MIEYFRASKIKILIIFSILILLSICLHVSAYFWLGYVWSNHLSMSKNYFIDFIIFVGLDFLNCKKNSVTSCLNFSKITRLIQGLIIWMANYFFIRIANSASRMIHRSTLNSLLKSNLEFFETTPLICITSLFYNQIDNVDKIMPKTLFTLIIYTLKMIAIMVTVSTVSPFFLVCILPVLSLLYLCEVGKV